MCRGALGMYVVHVIQMVELSLSAALYFCESAMGLAWMVTRSNLTSFVGLFFSLTGTRSIRSSVESCPSITRPKMVYLPSSDGCLAYEMKNWCEFGGGTRVTMMKRPELKERSPATCSSPAQRWPSRRPRAC